MCVTYSLEELAFLFPNLFLLPFFFLHLYCHHPDLHSFPTRRSSDLYIFLTGNTVELGNWSTTWHGAVRSEEHTSELQSPCNLVCRLLLEKKNIESLLTVYSFISVLTINSPTYCSLSCSKKFQCNIFT